MILIHIDIMEDKEMNRENMEEIILRTAEDMFLDKGYNGVSTTDIAKRVGCNQALIHYYYRTKTKLFTKIFERKVESVLAKVRVKFDDNLSFREKVGAAVESYFDFLSENPRLPLFLLDEARDNAEAVEIMKRTFLDGKDLLLAALQKSIDEECENGTIYMISAFDMIFNIVSMCVFPFIAHPLITNVIELSEDEYQRFLKERKNEVIRLILCMLEKKND